MTSVEHRSATPLAATPLPATVPVTSGQLRSRDAGHRVLNWLALLMPWVIAGYILFDRAFAYVTVPGAPFYIGEFVVFVAVMGALVATGHIHRAMRHSTATKLLIAWMLWGVLRTVPYIGIYKFNAIRDAALWYYALVAIPVCALVLRDAELITRWAGMYRRFIPWFLIWAPIALLMGSAIGTNLNLFVPGSSTSVFDHKPGNIAVNIAIALAFLWLVPNAAGRYRPFLTGCSTVMLLVVFSQNRGGFIAAQRRARVGVALRQAARAHDARDHRDRGARHRLGLGAQHPDQERQRPHDLREPDRRELRQRDRAPRAHRADGNLDSTVQFRKNLWSAVITKVKTEKKVLTGLGFGTDIAKEVGFQGGGDTQLRSPHNSHVDVFARMGVIGLAIWLAFWAFFFFTALRTRFRLIATGPHLRDRLRQRLHRGGHRDLGERLLRPHPRGPASGDPALDAGGAHVRACCAHPPRG